MRRVTCRLALALMLLAPAAARGQQADTAGLLAVRRPDTIVALGRLRNVALTAPALDSSLLVLEGVDPLDDDDSVWSLTPAGTGLPAAGRAALPSPALVVSRQQRNLVWLIVPGGSEVELHAADTAGSHLGTWRLAGARNVDWSALALGPCGREQCLYIADTGDSLERRPVVSVYRVVEPLVPFDRLGRTLSLTRAQRIDFSYPDGPHDVRALAVERDGSLLLFAAGRRRNGAYFRVPASAWFDRGRALPRELGLLPIDLTRLGPVSGAALSPDGSTLVLRTTRAALFLSPDGQRITRPGCDLSRLPTSGHGLDWAPNGGLMLTAITGLPRGPGVFRVGC